ncbi:hypothetical protein [Shewanella glacialipiscicola]
MKQNKKPTLINESIHSLISASQSRYGLFNAKQFLWLKTRGAQ